MDEGETSVLRREDVFGWFDRSGLDILGVSPHARTDFVEPSQTVFVFRGPCGHTRRGRLQDATKMCPSCLCGYTMNDRERETIKK